MVIQRSQFVLIGGMLLALVPGMVLGLTTGLFKGPQEAHAQPSPGNALFHLCKEWVPNGFKLVEQFDGLPMQHMMFFEKEEKEKKEVQQSDR